MKDLGEVVELFLSFDFLVFWVGGDFVMEWFFVLLIRCLIFLGLRD